MDLWYYPGCTLKTKGLNLESPALPAMAALDVHLKELPRWNCCGALHSLATDDLFHQIAPVRLLIRAKEAGADKLVTICDFCYNTLRRADALVRDDEEKRNTLNSFMDEEPDYEGDVDVTHLLQTLRDDVGWDRLKDAVKVPLEGVKIAAYYGCALLRPAEIAIDDVEHPTVLQDLVTALGAEAVDFPLATECCGSYQAVANPDVMLERSKALHLSASNLSADLIVLSCPLCAYNLGRVHEDKANAFVPVVTFTQLLALAVGVDPDVCRFDLNKGHPERVLADKVPALEMSCEAVS